MTRLSYSRLLALTLVVLALAGGGVGTGAAQGQRAAPPTGGPGAYYLSLGDGLAFGYQPFKPLTVGFGFSDFLATSLETINPDLRPVNLGCPGEDTTTYLKGKCQAAALLRYQGAQSKAALAFLKAHPNQVNPITLAIGAGDLLAILTAPQQLTVTLQTIATNENTIVMGLRQAAPKADIVMFDYYNPFTVLPTNTLPVDTIPVVTALNHIIDQTAARYRAKVVNLYSVFNTPVNSPLLCNLTWMCSSYRDIHGTTLGYKVIARMVAATLGYPGLTPPPGATNPEGISSGVPGPGGTITWFWIGDQNATAYDVVVYHYQGSTVVRDQSVTVAAGQRRYTWSGAKCGVAYQVKVRSQGPGHPSSYYSPSTDGKVPCAPQQ